LRACDVGIGHVCSMPGIARSSQECVCFFDVGKQAREPDEWSQLLSRGFERAWGVERSELGIVEGDCVWRWLWAIAYVDICEDQGYCLHGECVEIRHIVAVSWIWGYRGKWTVLDDGGRGRIEREHSVLLWSRIIERLGACEQCE